MLTNTRVVRCSLHQLGDAVEHLAHLLAGHHRLELAVGQLEGQVELAAVAGVDDPAAGRPSAPAATGRGRPPSRRADASPMGRCVAEQPDPPGAGGGAHVLEPLEA